jgi:uncharacterized protein YbjT (DUF2867 family)
MILVTGATGNIGPNVVRSLQERGLSVRAGIHVQPLDIDGIETCTIDFDQPETLPPALEGIDALFLLSSEVAHEEAMVVAARQAGVARIVYMSSFKADTDHFLVGQLHRRIELQIEAGGMKWTFLRPNYLMQNFLRLMADDIRNDDAFYDSIGDARISCFDARDVGPAAATVLTERGHAGRAYDLSGPEAISYHDAAGMLSDALGRTIRYVQVDDEEYRRRYEAKGVPRHYVDFLVDVNREAREGRTNDHVVTTAFKEITGSPATPFARFCRDHARHFEPSRVLDR